LKKGNIIAGGGYSSDSLQITHQVCFNGTISTGEQRGRIRMDTGLSYSQMISELGVSASVKASWRFWSAEAEASYMQSLEETEYSLSLNYYQYISNNVNVHIAGAGTNALTEEGKGFYNDGKNPYFGLLCGDYYISSYEQGALLKMGINIKFSSSLDKKSFEAHASASFLSIAAVTASVKDATSKYNMQGSVSIQAYQKGGDPSELSGILGKDSSGQYYATTCSFKKMDACSNAAGQMLGYAATSFKNQVSTKNNTGLVPLGIGFTEYYPIEYLGLTPPASLVTPEVLQYRGYLANVLEENEFFQEKLHPFLNRGYPGKLDDNFIEQVKYILQKTKHNIGQLMQFHGGAGDCWKFPDRCKTFVDDIKSKLHNITEEDLKFLDPIRYAVTAHVCYVDASNISVSYLYNVSLYRSLDSKDAWSISYPPAPNFTITDHKISVLSNDEYKYRLVYTFSGNETEYTTTFEGKKRKNSGEYEGTLKFNSQEVGQKLVEKKVESPYFFYSPSYHSASERMKFNKFSVTFSLILALYIRYG